MIFWVATQPGKNAGPRRASPQRAASSTARQGERWNGRLKLDEPTNLPEGTVVPLEIARDWDDLDDEERAALHASIEEAERELDAGQVVTEEELWARLRAIS